MYPNLIVSPNRATQGAAPATPGLPAYGRGVQFERLVELIERRPSQDELRMAYLMYGYYGVVNPLVASQEVREQCARQGNVLHELLLSLIHI